MNGIDRLLTTIETDVIARLEAGEAIDYATLAERLKWETVRIGAEFVRDSLARHEDADATLG